jgi:type I restriction enzyme R subunit
MESASTALDSKSHDRQPRARRPHSILGSAFYDPNQPVKKQEQKLPHWQQGEVWVFVTWRLADSLPQSKIRQWKEERERWMKVYPKPWDQETELKYQKRFNSTVEHWLDAGYGSCCLLKPSCAQKVADALHYFDGVKYQLADYIVMPNHVHVLFRLIDSYQLSEVVQGWKSFTAKEINRELGSSGALWQANYWDRLVRSLEHFEWVRRYIAKNPKNLNVGKYVAGARDLKKLNGDEA